MVEASGGTGAGRGLRVGDLVRRNARDVPDRVAASLGAETLTHGELDRAANRLARRLASLGIGHGDRVMSWADTGLAVLPLFAALAKLGAVFAPLNARYGVAEATDVATLARASLLVADAERAESAAELAKAMGIPRHGHIAGAGPGLDLRPEAVDESDADVDEPALRETDPHVVFFTSGSTGRPKGVVLSHRANLLRTFHGVFRNEPERSVCMFPLFHMAGFILALSAWQTRGEIALVGQAGADEILSAVERRRANRLYCIPAVWGRILETDPGGHDTSSLREIDTGMSATPVELLRALKARFPDARLRVYYGSTEIGAGTSLADGDVLRKPGSVGRPAPGVDLALAEDGEILVRSAYLCDGYFDDPDATAEAFRDGWFRTGDLGALDKEGHLSVIGRRKELIRSGGESIAPAEVEAVLRQHPDVADAAVVGLPDPSWGEVVCAAVVPAAGASPTLESLQAHCEPQLASFKKPRRLVQRTLLVEQIASGRPGGGGA